LTNFLVIIVIVKKMWSIACNSV